MKTRWQKNLASHSTLFRILIILLVLGVFFRFVNLDKKNYWKDETYTSLRISGYTQTEMFQQVFDGRIIGIEDLQKYQRPNPEKGLIDTIRGLAIEEPQHPPLYFVIAKYWVQWLGNSVGVTRSLSALISLLVFPCLYWLCLELFELPFVGWVAIALLAISPFHVLYAQEARQYSLWTVTILLSSTALLRGIRLKTRLSWGIYAVTVALGLYSFMLSGLVVISHGIYIIAIKNFRLSKTVTAYLCASFVGLIAFTPWLLVVITNLHQTQNSTDWLAKKTSLLSLVMRWAGNLSRIFLDLGLDSSDSLINVVPLIPLILILLTLVGYSIYFLCHNTPKRVWLFVVTLIVVPALALVLPDLILGGRRSGTARYMIPCYLGIQLAVAYLLATQMTCSFNIRRQKLWQLVMIALVSSGILSCAISSQAEMWWNKGSAEEPYIPQMARIINQSTHPLLVSYGSPGNIRSLSHLLNPTVQLQLMVEPNIPKIAHGFSDVFLYNPSKALRSEIEKQNYIPVHELGRFQDKFWRLTPGVAAFGGTGITDIKDTNYPIPIGAYFVSPNGLETNSGKTPDSPWSIAKALAKAPSGATIVFRSGTYRDIDSARKVGRIRKKLTLQPYPHEKAWIKGSVIVKGWVTDDAIWRKDNWKYSFPADKGSKSISPKYPMAGYRDMVYVNDVALKQVASKAEVGPGKFYVDSVNKQLYIGDNPAGKTVEASQLSTGFKIWKTDTANPTGTVIRGLGFAHYADRAIVVGAPHVTLENNTFVWNGVQGVNFEGGSTKAGASPDARVVGNT